MCAVLSAIFAPSALAHPPQVGGMQPMAGVSVNSFSPTSGTIGTLVRIYGGNFGSSQGTGYVLFTGTSTHATIQYWSSDGTEVDANVPNGATTGVITVYVNGGGHGSSSSAFTVNPPAPSITSASPNPTTVGTSVTIGGSNFGSSRGTSTVSFNGTAATTYGTWSATSVQATVPTNATSGYLVVTVGGQNSNNWSFTVTPHITSLSVTTGAVGTAFTISGSGFGAAQGSSTVTVGGAVATVTSGNWGASSINTSVPNGAPVGSDNVVVTVNGVASNASVFTVTASKTNTSTGLVSSLNPSAYGSIVTFTATVTPSQATGTVTFKDGSTQIGTGTLSGGVATLNISWLTVATHSITAVYGGDSNYNGSTSSVVSQVVNALTITKPGYCVY